VAVNCGLDDRDVVYVLVKVSVGVRVCRLPVPVRLNEKDLVDPDRLGGVKVGE